MTDRILSLMCAIVCAISTFLSSQVPAGADEEPRTVLHGSAEENAQAQTRIHHFDADSVDDSAKREPVQQTRLHRSSVAMDGHSNQEMFQEFAKVDPNLFVSKSHEPYDLESEQNSRELMIAWELWHKQLSEQMYRRLRPIAAGIATFKLSVTRDHHISIQILNASGYPGIPEQLKSAARQLDGNVGLSFPEGSKRQVAYDSHTYICGKNVTPGYNWQRGDLERVRQTW